MKKTNSLLLIALVSVTAVLSAEEAGKSTAVPPKENGKSLLKNGSFEDVDKNGNPKYWALRRGASLVKSESGNALKLEGVASYAFELIWWDELKQSPRERKIAFSFKASGKGSVKVGVFRYTDTKDPKAKNGYRRKNVGTDFAGPYQLTEKPQTFRGEYTVRADEWIGFGFLHAPGTAMIDDVSIRLVK